MKQWWNEKDFIEIIEEKILTEELRIDEAVDTIIKDIK